MKRHALILAAGLVGGLCGAATLANAQQAPDLPPGPLEHLQDVFGQVVGDGFGENDDKKEGYIYRQPALVGLGEAGRAGLLASGGIFAGAVKPFADADAAANPGPVNPGPHLEVPHPRHRHAKRHAVSPGTAG